MISIFLTTMVSIQYKSYFCTKTKNFLLHFLVKPIVQAAPTAWDGISVQDFKENMQDYVVVTDFMFVVY